MSDKDLKGSNPYGDWLKNAIVMAPIVAGAGAAIQRIRSNAPISVQMPGASIVPEIARQAGDHIKDRISVSKARREQKSQELVKKITSMNLDNDIWKSVAEQKAVTQSLLETVNDPSIGLTETQSRQLTDNLTRSLQQIGDNTPQEIKDLIAKAAETIAQMPEAIDRFERRYQQWRGAGPYMTTGTFKGEFKGSMGGAAGNADWANTPAAGRIGRAREMFGKDFEVLKGGEAGGLYIRYTGGKGRGVPIPVMMGAGNRFHMGEGGQTIYSGADVYGRAGKLEEFYNQHGTKGANEKAMRTAGALIGLEDYALDIVEDEYRQTASKGGQPMMEYVDWQRVGSRIRDVSTVGSRGQDVLRGTSHSRASKYVAHRTAADKLSNANVRVVGMERLPRSRQQRLFEQMIGTSDVFGPAPSSGELFSRTQDNRIIANLGYAPNAPIRQLRTYGAMGASDSVLHRAQYAQVTARFEQITGRGDNMFLGGHKIGGYAANVPVDWSEQVTGGVNKLVLMDFNNTLGLKGEGQALATGPMQVAKGFTKPIINPGTGASTLLTQKILEDTAEGGEIELTRDALKRLGTALGVDASGNMQHLRVTPGTKSVVIRPQFVGAHGKEMIHMAGIELGKIWETKLFSTLFKGTIIPIDEEKFARSAADIGFGRDFMRAMGASNRDTIIVAGEMLKKSPENVNSALITAMGMLTQSDHTIHQKFAAASQARYGLGDGYVAKTIGTAISMMSNTLDHEKTGWYGHALAGMYETAPDMLEFKKGKPTFTGPSADWSSDELANWDSQFKAVHHARANAEQAASNIWGGRRDEYNRQRYAMERDGTPLSPEYEELARRAAPFDKRAGDLANEWVNIRNQAVGRYRASSGEVDIRARMTAAVRQHFGNDTARADAVIKGMTSGRGFGLTYAVPGPQPGDWGASRGAIEPRTIEMLMEKMRGMGHSTEQISGFVGSLMSRRVGMEQNMALGNAFMRMWGGVQGHGTLPLPNARTVNIAELTGMAGADRNNYVANLLKSNEEVWLDFGAQPGLRGSNALADAANRAFGTTSIPLPGGSTLKHMRDAEIRTTGGNIHIAPEYQRLVGNFMDNVLSLSTNQQKAEDGATKLFQRFQEDSSALASKTVFGMSRGKIRASQYMQSSAYVMNKINPQLSKSQRGFVHRAIKKTQGSATFVTGSGFLDIMRDSRSDFGNQEVGGMMKRFFLGGETESAKGVPMLVGRDPNLSLGHIGPQMVYRHVKERYARETDPIWGAFTNTAMGKKAVAKLEAEVGHKIRGFHDIQKHSNVMRDKSQAGVVAQARRNKAVNKFFTTMAGGIDKYHHSEGGGIAYFPQIKGSVKIKGRDETVNVDLSNWTAAGGDNDGDSARLMALSKNEGGKLLSTLNDSKAKDAWLVQDARYRLASELYMSEAKDSLDRTAAEQGIGMEDAERVLQDVLKERASKEIGPTEIALNKIRLALVTTGGDKEMNSRALALLKTTTEVAGLKSKKLPEFTDLPERITNAVNEMVAGDATNFRSLMTDELFKGSQLNGDGLTIEKYTGAGNKKAIEGFTLTMRPELEHMVQAVNKSQANNPEINLITAGQTLQQFKGPRADEMWHNFNTLGNTLQTGLLSGNKDEIMKAARAAGGIATQATDVMSKIDRHAAGLMMAGLAGGAVLGSLLGVQSYKSSPMEMQGEMVSPSIRQAVHEGRALNNDVQIDPGSISGGGNSLIPQGPLNLGLTYQERPNAYQIRGETSGYGGVSQASQYISGMTRGGGRGSMTVNDTRRPITPNYIDRLMGS